MVDMSIRMAAKYESVVDRAAFTIADASSRPQRISSSDRFSPHPTRQDGGPGCDTSGHPRTGTRARAHSGLGSIVQLGGWNRAACGVSEFVKDEQRGCFVDGARLILRPADPEGQRTVTSWLSERDHAATGFT
jgi:hypothetical protein